MVFVTKTKCQFLLLAAICRKIKHSIISFLFHVSATLKDDTVFSCDARSPGGGGYYTYFGYGDVPSGRVSIFTILV